MNDLHDMMEMDNNQHFLKILSLNFTISDDCFRRIPKKRYVHCIKNVMRMNEQTRCNTYKGRLRDS